MALVFLAWVAGRAWRGGLERSAVLRAAGALALPLAVTAAPFLLWDAGALLRDAVLFHASLAPPRYPIGGAGFPALLSDLDVIHDPGGGRAGLVDPGPDPGRPGRGLRLGVAPVRVADLLWVGAADPDRPRASPAATSGASRIGYRGRAVRAGLDS